MGLMEDTLLSDAMLVILGGFFAAVTILSLYWHYRQWTGRYMGNETTTFLKALLLK